MHFFGRLRINIGVFIREHASSAMVALAAILLFASICYDAKAQTAQAVLPFYTADGFSTAIIRSNHTDAEIVIRQSSATIKESIAPHARTIEPVTRPGLGVISVSAPVGLTVYAEITNPFGAKIPVFPLQPREMATLHDLVSPSSSNYNSGVFIGALEDTVATILGTGKDATILAGTAVILPAPAEYAEVRNELVFGQKGKAPIYVFGYVNHFRTGSLFSVVAEGPIFTTPK
jgi:hypothetical protein